MVTPPDVGFIALQDALAGEYSLDREIGRGGMGVVYLAREVRLARPVAIKVLPPALAADETLRAAFLREAQTAARLNHPNIVPIHGAGELGGFVYIVMAYVEGTTLGERIRTRGPLLPGQAARVLRESAWALAYAHAAGIVHRDVSAENILLERGSDRAIVMDFGIASAMQTAALSADGHVLGNAHYVSPEQAAGEPLDARSDLYSLGVCGFYALTGRLPFDAPTSADVVALQIGTPAPRIGDVNSAVPARLAQAVDRCLAKLPVARYRNAESFAEAIDLAFEHAREIPTALRVWINEGEKEVPARVAMLGIGTMAGITTSLGMGQTWWFIPPFALLLGISAIPLVQRLRRVLGEGYLPDDLHAALREHQLVRAEEIEYERRLRSPRFASIMRTTFGASLGTTALAVYLVNALSHIVWKGGYARTVVADAELQMGMLLFVSASALTASSVGIAGEFVRLRLSTRLAASSIKFWKSRWGHRLAKLVAVGLDPAERPALGMPLLTEVALGRATDNLFSALPKAARRELASLPGTVKRLEEDASRLRASIVGLDDQLAIFERGGEALDDDDRHDVADELREARSLGAERLAATVSALEMIRLDLLRLQMGSVGIESVTASLDAARAVGEQLAQAVAAQDEVERLLGLPGPAYRERTTSVS